MKGFQRLVLSHVRLHYVPEVPPELGLLRGG